MLCHSDHKEFLCQICGKQFKRKDKLKEHLQRMHSPNREIKLAAKKAAKKAQAACTQKFIPKVSPTDYQRFIYKCHICLLGFKRRGMLVNHLAKRHPDISPNTVPELNLPILKTTREYYCLYCDKIYKSSSKRKSHILKNHSGKPLPLSNYQKSSQLQLPGLQNPTFSATVGSVTIHPQYCDWCHKQYASKAKLLQHQRKKHPENLPVIDSVVKSRNKATYTLDQTDLLSPLQSINTSASSVNLFSETSTILSSQLDNPFSSSSLITSNSTLETNNLTLLPLQPSSSSSSSSSISGSLPTTFIGNNLVTILGNISNVNGIMMMPTLNDINLSESSDFQVLLQTHPANNNDLLTQAMSELAQTKDSNLNDTTATFLVPALNNQMNCL